LQSVEKRCTTLQEWHSPQTSSDRNSIEQRALPETDAHFNLLSPQSSVTPSAPSVLDSIRMFDGALVQKNFNPTVILKRSVDQVQKQVINEVAKSVITDAAHIPKELAKIWVKCE
jgi:hypothetical protein